VRLSRSLAIAVGALLCAACLGLLYLTVIVAWGVVGISQPSSSAIVLGVQRELYENLRPVWQADPQCARFDAALIYVPREGECAFKAVEFDTRMHFDENGRQGTSAPGASGRPVVVLGDSHAMGWGVNDGETFAARLSAKLARPVLNLAVSSYGTDRELRRLAATPAARGADTIIIQYCENDIAENRARLRRAETDAKAVYAQITAHHEAGMGERLSLIGRLYKAAFHSTRYAFYRAVGHRVRAEEPLEFGGHYDALIGVLRDMPELASRRVIVFYSNGHGRAFSGFPRGRDASLPNVEFVDIEMSPSDFHRLDDHPTAAGHEKMATKLAALIQAR
jgi:lysophospholipase L1-like esterase